MGESLATPDVVETMAEAVLELDRRAARIAELERQLQGERTAADWAKAKRETAERLLSEAYPWLKAALRSVHYHHQHNRTAKSERDYRQLVELCENVDFCKGT